MQSAACEELFIFSYSYRKLSSGSTLFQISHIFSPCQKRRVSAPMSLSTAGNSWQLF